MGSAHSEISEEKYIHLQGLSSENQNKSTDQDQDLPPSGQLQIHHGASDRGGMGSEKECLD